MKMRDGLIRSEFYQEYQPKFRGHTRELSGVEALARWRDAEGNQISPGIFIPVAEASGLIHELGLWALQSACIQQVEWSNNGYPGISMAVNISARQFHHGNLASLVGHVIGETGVDPTMLQIEITESTLMQDIDQAEEQLRGLADLGVSIAVDDFGTGLFQPRLSEAVPGHGVEDRPLLREGHSPRPRRSGDRSGHHHHGQELRA